MALKKKVVKDGLQTEVTFKINRKDAPSDSDIFLLGDFNHWQMADTGFQMERKKGWYTKTIILDSGKKYEFRYVNRDFIWFNDDAADAYVPSPFYGVDNCVVDLTQVEVKAKPVQKGKKDDLKKIEGIGPKIASILKENGIDTFKKLSEAKVKKLEALLKEAGPRFSMHKPDTWPKQAKLAKEGRWEELKRLQDKLDGGKL